MIGNPALPIVALLLAFGLGAWAGDIGATNHARVSVEAWQGALKECVDSRALQEEALTRATEDFENLKKAVLRILEVGDDPDGD